MHVTENISSPNAHVVNTCSHNWFWLNVLELRKLKHEGGGFPSHQIVILQDYIIQYHQQLGQDAYLALKEFCKVSNIACV